MFKQARKITYIENSCQRKPDGFYIACSSFEERCLGVPKLLSETSRFRNAYNFKYDEPSEKRDRNLEKLESLLETKGNVECILTLKNRPLPSMKEIFKKLKLALKEKSSAPASVVLDISTFTKCHLLLLLKIIDDLELWGGLRIFYTEPKQYITDLYLPLSIGIQSITPISGFISNSSPNLPLLLLIFLGYEGDRASAIYENLDPEETLLVVPKPAYHDEWEGRTEEMNRALIRTVGEGKITYADSIDPFKVASQLEGLQKEFNTRKWKWVIVPLGTKPQALGTYFFWRRYPNAFSIVYAQPFKHNQAFFSTGIGRTWLLKD